MDTAQCSVNNIIKNESGSILLGLTFLAIIAGGVGFYMSVNDNADKEIRNLGGIKTLSYLKADIENTLKKTIAGKNTQCPTTITNELRNKFIKFSTSAEDAQYKILISENDIKKSPITRCFFNPSRFPIDFKELAIDINRTSEPNFLQGSSILTINTRIATQLGKTRNQHKYLTRYNVSIKNLESYLLIGDGSNKLFDINSGANLHVNGDILIDQNDRNKSYLLDNLITASFDQIRYGGNVNVAAPSLVIGEDGKRFLEHNPLTNIFSAGLNLDALPLTITAPYQHANAQRWSDIFDYSSINEYYPLPQLNSGTAVIGSNNHGLIRKFGEDHKTNKNFNPKSFHNNTKNIYTSIYGTDGGKLLAKSCSPSDIESGYFNILIFNNFAEEFIIDFRENKSPENVTNPAIFCGLIAARSITVYLSDETPSTPNEFFGKMMVKERIKVIGKGTLRLNDLVTVSNEQIINPAARSLINLANLKLQYYNQKYFSSQNFALPFFTDSSIYSSSNPDYLFYVPRATRDFFNQSCDLPVPDASLKCRQAEIKSPDIKFLTSTLGDRLVYDIRILE